MRMSAALASLTDWMMTNMSSIPMPNRIGGMMRLTLVQNRPISPQQLVIRTTERKTAVRPAMETQKPVKR